MSLENLLITGGREGGIGFAVARAYGKFMGDSGVVHLTAHREQDAVAAARILEREGFCVEPYGMDVTNLGQIETVVDRIFKGYGAVTGLLNTAVLDDLKQTITEVPIAEAEDIFNVNAMGPFRVIRSVLPGMQAAGHNGEGFGRIAVVYGTWSNYERANELRGKGGIYGAAKSAEAYLVKAFARDLEMGGFTDILINAVDPGKVGTNMNPGGLRQPDEVAPEILKLIMLPQGSGINGELFRDGRQVPFDSYIPATTLI